MKLLVRSFCMMVFLFVVSQAVHAQILAITKDGQRVILFGDGTWKFEIEVDSTRIPITGQPVSPSIAPQPETPQPELPPPAPVKPPKPPRVYSLECKDLVDTERDINHDAYTSVSRKLSILKEDSTEAFSISMMKSKKSALLWTSTIKNKVCITAENKMNLVLKDGTVYVLVTDSQPNCDGNFKLYFGNLYGKDTPLESLKKTEIAAVRIYTKTGFVEGNFDEENARKFKAALNCMLK